MNPECDCELAPVLCTALASLSGMLETCQSDGDLDEAVGHGIALMGMGVFGQPELHAEVQAVLAEVGRWGQQAEARSGMN